ncbi:hypothetical protein pah_c209o037 [Parachlamydia acanthamoebae str. Hall's coccus]|nr:hypothetical protein pah_c209o037 [Parachlamydia acanthamoebae str. Hall's coccus]
MNRHMPLYLLASMASNMHSRCLFSEISLEMKHGQIAD